MFPTFGPDVGGNAFNPTLATMALGIVPQSLNIGNTVGAGVDFNAGSGKCWATLQTGAWSGTAPTLDGKIQESTDNVTFTDVSGGGFAQITTANQSQTIAFTRTKRYLRANVTVGGTPMNSQAACTLAEANQ
jgi:hypothetical protein